jgi:hypothetical protein
MLASKQHLFTLGDANAYRSYHLDFGIRIWLLPNRTRTVLRRRWTQPHPDHRARSVIAQDHLGCTTMRGKLRSVAVSYMARSGYVVEVTKRSVNNSPWLTCRVLPSLHNVRDIGANVQVLLPREIILIHRAYRRKIAIRADGLECPILIGPVYKTSIRNVWHIVGPGLLCAHRSAIR